MVVDEITDGYRIAQLLASEIDGRRSGPLGRLSVANPDRSVEGTPEGERAYDVRRLAGDRDPRREPTREDAGEVLARVYVHGDGATVAVYGAPEATVDAADGAGLATGDRTEGVRSDPRRNASKGVRVAVDRAADVKRAADVLAAASDAADGNG